MSTEVADDLVSSLTLEPEVSGDEDTEEELEAVFSEQYLERGSVCLSLASCSVLGLEQAGAGAVAALSHTGRLTCYDLERLSPTWDLGPEQTVRGVRSHATDCNLLLTCGSTVKLWDVREPREAVMEMSGPASHSSLSCLAASRAGLVVAGTDLQGLDAFLLFWDIKAGGDLLGGYWNVHSGKLAQFDVK